MKLVITGGGTGGHIFGGVAIAQEFLARDPKNEVLFVGSSYGLETRLVPKAGYRLETLKLGKLVGQSFFSKLLTLLQIPLAVFKAVLILHRAKADMVIGVGGYASGPCLIAARLLCIHCGVLEQNSVAGLTNKISAIFSNHVFTAFPEVPKGFAVKKCVYTGNPVRSQLKPVVGCKSSAPFTVFAFGGSQGASGINRLLTGAVKILNAKGVHLHVVHQTGERDYNEVVNAYQGIANVEVHAFIDDMQSMYDRASLVICRSGSGTIAELGATQNAALFIPFPQAAGGHQEKNATAVEAAGAACVLLQGTATADDLARTIEGLKNDPNRLEKMRTKIISFYRPDAARKILNVMTGIP